MASTSDRLGKVAKFYYREARKCERAKAYFAAAVLQVAGLEATLQAMCSLYPKDVKSTAIYQRKRFRRKRDRALEFSLNQLINIAHELSWFPPKQTTWAGKRTNLAGFAHEIRKVRNLVHPGEWARKRESEVKISKGVYDAVYEVVGVANSWLIHRVEQNLLRRIERDENREGRG